MNFCMISNICLMIISLFAMRRMVFFKGISIDIMKIIWKELGISEQEVHVYPWARAYSNLQNDEKNVLLGIIRTPERENICKWVGPIAKLRFGVFALKKKHIKIRNFEDLNSFKIGTINKDIVEELLLQKGFKGEQESSSRNINNLKKLYAQRIDLAGSFEISFYQDIKDYGYNTDDFEFVYILKEMDAYIGFNKNIPDKTIKKVSESS